MSEPDPYTPYCDVYSFGVVIYELVSGQLPYSNMHERDLVSHVYYYNYAQNVVFVNYISHSKILFMVGRGFLRPEPSHARKDTPKAFKQLLVKCCGFNKDERPLFPQASLIVSTNLVISETIIYNIIIVLLLAEICASTDGTVVIVYDYHCCRFSWTWNLLLTTCLR